MKLFTIPSMLRLALLISCYFLNHCKAVSQENQPFCGAAELQLQLLKDNPSLAGKLQAIESQYLEFASQSQDGLAQKIAYTLPVVIHIVHFPGTPIGVNENLTEADAKAGLALLNNAFAGIPCGGDAAGLDIEIQFELAKKDINGFPTTGIHRYESQYSEFGLGGHTLPINATLGGGYPIPNRFPGTDYINIYLVKGICYLLPCAGPLGLAFGHVNHGRKYDGIIIESQVWYNPNDLCRGGKLAAHEMGHYFNLLHTFQDGCQNDDCLRQGDRVCDTSPDNIGTSSNTFCLSGTFNNSCSTDSYTTICDTSVIDQPDPEDNYMDYSPFPCKYRFTQGQKTRMQSALFGPRASLLASKGLQSACEPVITIQLNVPDEAIKGTPEILSATVNDADSIVWKINGIAISNSPSLSYTFPNFGAYNVQLQAFNNSGCMVTATKNIDVFHTDCNFPASVGQIPLLCKGSGTFELSGYPANGTWTDANSILYQNEITISKYAPGTHPLYYKVRQGWCEKVITTNFTVVSNEVHMYASQKLDCSNPAPVQVFIESTDSGIWYNSLGQSGAFSEPFDLLFMNKAGKYNLMVWSGSGFCEAGFFIPFENEMDVSITECGTCNGVKLCVDTLPPGALVQWSGGYPQTPGRWAVEVTNTNGCISTDYREVTSLDNLAPGCSAGSDISMICGTVVRLNGFISPAGELDFEWTTANGRLAGPKELTQAVDRPGTYYLRVWNKLTGCEAIDSVTVFPLVKKTTTSQTICFGETYEGLSISGVYSDTLEYACGCDSISVLNLTVLPENKTLASQTICFGESYEGYAQSGIYQNMFTAFNGCDSVSVLDLTVLPENTAFVSQTICAGETYEGYDQNGIYTDILTASNGCDSTRTLELSVLPNVSTSIAITICFGETYAGHSVGGTYTDVYPAVNGCDSTRLLKLTVLPAISASLSTAICFGETYEGYSQSGTYTDVFTAANGCDSTRVLELTVLPENSASLSTAICFGETYEGYSQSGTYTDVFTAANGCDSTRVLELTVLPEINITSIIQSDGGTNSGAIETSVTAGAGPFTYLWSNGGTASSINGLMHGSYSLTVTGAEGCEKVFGFVVPLVLGTIRKHGNIEVSLFPNPGKAAGPEKLRISAPSPATFTIRISDLAGRERLKATHFHPGGTSDLVFSLAQPGFYFVSLENEKGEQAVIKLVVE